MKVRARFWLETAFASLFGCVALLTIVWRDWAEALTGFDPDRHSGSFEWAIVFALIAICVGASSLARSELRRRAKPSPPPRETELAAFTGQDRFATVVRAGISLLSPTFDDQVSSSLGTA